jgi:hypothetical protein
MDSTEFSKHEPFIIINSDISKMSFYPFEIHEFFLKSVQHPNLIINHSSKGGEFIKEDIDVQQKGRSSIRQVSR